MFYQEALPKFQFLSSVDSLLTIGDRHWRKVATTFEIAESANSLLFAQNGCLFMWAGCLFFVWVLIDGFHGAWLHFQRAKVGVWV